jgi:hypothetical protein
MLPSPGCPADAPDSDARSLQQRNEVKLVRPHALARLGDRGRLSGSAAALGGLRASRKFHSQEAAQACGECRPPRGTDLLTAR